MVGSGSQGVAKGHMRDGASQGGVKVVRHTYHAHPAPHAQSGRLFARPPSSPGASGVEGSAPAPCKGGVPPPSPCTSRACSGELTPGKAGGRESALIAGGKFIRCLRGCMQTTADRPAGREADINAETLTASNHNTPRRTARSAAPCLSNIWLPHSGEIEDDGEELRFRGLAGTGRGPRQHALPVRLVGCQRHGAA